MMQHAPALAIAVPLFAAFATPLLGRVGERIRNAWVLASLILTELLVAYLNYEVLKGGIRTYALGASLPSLGSPQGFPVRIVLEIDAMNALVSLIAVSMAIAAVVYCWRFIEALSGDKEHTRTFYSLLLLFIAGMVGMSFTGDFFTLFVFIELTSVSSASLVSFFRDGESFEAAFKYLILSAIGALFLLFGVGILYGQYGMLNMAAIAAEMAMGLPLLDRVALAMIVSAILLKIGPVPLHMWKPDIYQKVPSPVAAVCVASSLVGVYVLSRILFSVFFVMGSLTGWIIISLGVLSILVGVTMSLLQRNLKRMIAYAAIAEIGYAMLGIGTGLAAASTPFGPVALSGGIFQLMNDVLNMGLLFLVAGTIFYATRKTDIDDLGGLAHHSASLTALFVVGLLAVSGLPPLNGFASKLMIYESVFCLNPLLAIVGILGSIIMLAILVKVFVSVFLGLPRKGMRRIPTSMMAAMWIIALFIILLGMFPEAAIDSVVTPAADALINHGAYMGGAV
jgi:multicomponent Na+:H+ antiporter subunit D